MTRKPFSVRIFLQDGDAHGVRIVSRSKWSGRGLVIPIASLAAELERKELKAPGVYLLTGPDASADRPVLHIGAADQLCDGLAPHATEGQSWSMVVAFTCKEDSLDPAQFRSIAANLLQLARAAGRARVCGMAYNASPPLNAAAKSFLDHLLSLCPLLGVTAFT